MICGAVAQNGSVHAFASAEQGALPPPKQSKSKARKHCAASRSSDRHPQGLAATAGQGLAATASQPPPSAAVAATAGRAQ